MPLYEYEIAGALLRHAVPEMIEADLVERRGRRVARNVAADVRMLVRAQDHRHRVPARVRADPILDVLIARNAHLPVDRNRVDVRGIRGKRHVRARSARSVDQLLDQKVRAIGPLDGEDGGERVQPFPRFLRVQVFLHFHDVILRRASRFYARRFVVYCCGAPWEPPLASLPYRGNAFHYPSPKSTRLALPPDSRPSADQYVLTSDRGI